MIERKTIEDTRKKKRKARSESTIGNRSPSKIPDNYRPFLNFASSLITSIDEIYADISAWKSLQATIFTNRKEFHSRSLVFVDQIGGG